MPTAQAFQPLDIDELYGYPEDELEQMAAMEAAVHKFESQRKYIPAIESLEGVVSIRRELLGSDAPEFRAAVEALAMHGLKSSLSAAHHGFKRSPVMDRETHLAKTRMSSFVKHVRNHCTHIY